MTVRRPAGLAATALTAALLLAVRPAHAGPPWISVEYPPNPMDRETRGAVLVVHTYHHGNVVWLPVSCAAEGLVRGQRRSVPCTLSRTSRPAVYVLKERVTPAEGVWMLVLTAGENEGGATALVEVDAAGAVTGVRVPTQVHREGTFPRRVTGGEIDAALRERADRTRVSERGGAGLGLVLGALGALFALPVGLGTRMRRTA